MMGSLGMPTQYLNGNCNWEGRNEPIAIIGMSFRYPGANTPEEFWNLLSQGRSAVGTLPEGHWPASMMEEFTDDLNDFVAGFLKDPLDLADAQFFGKSRFEAEFEDPQLRLMLETCWNCVEDAGISPTRLHNSNTAIFTGTWSCGYRDAMIQDSGVREHFYRKYTGNSFGAVAGKMAHFFGTTGPNISTDSACSSSMVAVGLGVKSLRNFETDMAMVCGVNLFLHPSGNPELEGMIALDGRSKTFGIAADGFGRGEGCGVLLLKRLSSALCDKDQIHGLIRGYGQSQEGTSPSFATPTVEGESRAIDLALADAGMLPWEINLVETHGTGTPIGDMVEILALNKSYSSPCRKEPLIISSMKPNTGHLESASGISAIIKTILSMKNQTVPPHIGCTEETLHPKLKSLMADIPALLPFTNVSWKATGNSGRRVAGINNIGITGTNAHLIVEEAPICTSIRQDAISKDSAVGQYIIAFSAKSQQSLEELLTLYSNYLTDTKEALSDITFTANVSRSALRPHRAAVVASSRGNMIQKLKDGNLIQISRVQGAGLYLPRPNLCFLFGGQGNQFKELGRPLYENMPIFRNEMDSLINILHKLIGCSLAETRDLIFSNVQNDKYAALITFCFEYSVFKLWEWWGVIPDVVVGHSMGEYAAVAAAGYLDVCDILKLLVLRQKSLDEAVKLGAGCMVAVIDANLPLVTKLIEESCKDQDKLDICCYNSPDQLVVGGPSSNVDSFIKVCNKRDIKTIVVNKHFAFHSHMMMNRAGSIFLEHIKRLNLKYKQRKCVYISATTGDILADDEMCDEYWIRNMVNPVQFQKASEIVLEHFNKAPDRLVCVEQSPHPILSSFLVANATSIAENADMGEPQPLVCLASSKKTDTDLATIFNTVGSLHGAGLDINWKNFYEHYPAKQIVSLPHYPFNRQKYWYQTHGRNSTKSKQDLGIVVDSNKKVHPYLGCRIPLAMSTPTVFHNILETHEEEVDCLMDHQLGENVIFPGAGYLDIFIAAALHSEPTPHFEPDCKYVSVENVKLRAPLKIMEGRDVTLQTTITDAHEDDNVNTSEKWKSVHIYSKISSSDWVCHASAKVLKSTTPKPQNPAILPSFELPTEDPGWIQVKPEVSQAKFYEYWKAFGLNFGPVFRSIFNAWEKEDVLIVQLTCFLDTKKQHMVHPILLDAVLQSHVYHNWLHGLEMDKLRLPTSIEQLTWYSIPSKDDAPFYAVIQGGITSGTKSLHLYSSSRKPIASLMGMELVSTDLNKLEEIFREQDERQSKLEDSNSSLANLRSIFFEETWEEGANQGNSTCLFPSAEFRFPHEGATPVDHVSPDAATDDTNKSFIEKHMDTAAGLLILKGLLQLGWDGQSTEAISKRITSEWKVKMFDRFVEVLQEDGYASTDGVKRGKPLPSMEDIKKMLTNIRREIANTNEKESDHVCLEMDLMSLCMEKLPTVLLENEDCVLPILFPSDPQSAKVSAEIYYKKTLKPLNDLLANVITGGVRSINPKDVNEKTCWKILEIGAGTGSSTAIVMQTLKENGITNFDYTFTDLSPAFFIKAEKKFGPNPHLRYKILDIEIDPLTQGFAPMQFDLVIACNVIHATDDLSRAIRHCNILTKGLGGLVLMETFIPNRVVDTTFGLLSGYWRFKDIHLRKKHTCINHKEWVDLIKSENYKDARAFAIDNDSSGVVMAVKSVGLINENISGNSAILSRKRWVAVLRDDQDCNGKFLNMLRGALDSCGRCLELVRRGNLSDYQFNQIESIEGILYLCGMQCVDPNTTGGPSELDHNVVAGGLLILYQKLATILPTNLGKKSHLSVLVVTEGGVQMNGGELFDWDIKNEKLNAAPLVPPTAGTLWGMMRTIKSESALIGETGIVWKTLDLGNIHVDHRVQIGEIMSEIWADTGSAQHSVTELRETHVGEAAYVQEQEGTISSQVQTRYGNHQRKRMIPKCAAVKDIWELEGTTKLPVPEGPYSLVLPESRLINDITFKRDQELSPSDCTGTLVQVQVVARALNFKDIFCVTKPSEAFERSNIVGRDFSGIVTKIGDSVTKWKVGDRVLGGRQMVAAPSEIRIQETLLSTLPPHLTFAEGSTFATVFTTAYHSLVTLGKLKKGEWILIHAATGGVGLIAIQIAKRIGAKIIGTAGTNRKRAYLRHSLGIQHIYSSRDLSFVEKIEKLTNGAGIQLVLNCLTGEGYKEGSLSLCGRNARFIEIGKLNAWEASDVRKLRSDVEYHLLDIDEGPSAEEMWSTAAAALDTQLKENQIDPLPYIRFPVGHIRAALTYFKQSKHIGKIVLDMARMPTPQNKLRYNLFNEQSSYVITGGMAGIGLHVANWMVANGAKYLILMGRNIPTESGGELEMMLTKLRENNGASITVIQGDVGKYKDVERVFDSLIGDKAPADGRLPPLRGIMHSAGALSDAVMINQNWESFQVCYNAKVNGAWNLHTLTVDKKLRLEHFVLYSSISSIVGTVGQGNHSSSNKFMDVLARYRYSLGLPATTINWGLWGTIGIASNLKIPGTIPLTPARGLAALESIMESNRTDCIVFEGDMDILKKRHPWTGSYLPRNLGNKKVKQEPQKKKKVDPAQFWEQYQAIEKKEEQLKYIEKFVCQTLFKLLKIDQDSGDKDGLYSTKFSDLGIDSLMGIEFRNSLQTVLKWKGISLLTSDMNTFNTVTRLSSRMYQLVSELQA